MVRIGSDKSFARKMDSIGWALFFVWVGVALLTNVSWTWALVGTAIIILGIQAILLLKGESIDLFMSAVGVVLLGGAVAHIYALRWSLFPAFLIVVGLVMLADTLRRPTRN